MIIGLPVECYPGERRAALVPSAVPKLAEIGLDLLVEAGAGERAGFPDSGYEEAGARIAADRAALFSSADLLVQVNDASRDAEASSTSLDMLRSGQVLIGLLNPLGHPQGTKLLAERGVTAFALELLPRISRAQSMDVLSSMATVAGYKAALLGAGELTKMYPMMITAAGTISPAKVFVVGAGVAGLQAIATSRRFGAVVRAYDIRPTVREEVESLGARFVELDLDTEAAEESGGYARAMDEEFYRRQRKMMSRVVSDSDVVITTAAVPGKKSPVLLTEQMVKGMRPGSVIVDLAAEGGGNCELTRPGESVSAHGVTIVGPLNLPATVPYHASQMYSRNVVAFLDNLVKDGEVDLDMEDEIIRETLLAHQGEVISPVVRELLGLPMSTDKAHAASLQSDTPNAEGTSR